jgi:two-component system, sensor histidine kinase and response regulator
VRDTGIGVPPDKRDAIFEPFVQADGSTTRAYGGTGLGLTISRNMAAMMGGTLDVESRPGEGSEFRFAASFRKQATARPARPDALPELENIRVLVVDDHPTNRILVYSLLIDWGMRCEEAAGPMAGLEMLRSAAGTDDPYRVAILDMLMPEMDGEELGRRIKTDPAIRDTVLIMMTSFGQRGDARRLEAAGFAAYLSKPFRREHLRDAIALALGATVASEASPEDFGLITRHTVAEARKRRIRILVAEDNRINAEVALRLLEKMGYVGILATDGAEALEILRNRPCDLVVMDCQMPIRDGWETARAIRAGEAGAENRDRPILALSAHAAEGVRERCLAAGMNAYLSKPVDPAAFSETIEACLRSDPRSGAEAPPSPAGVGEAVRDSTGTAPPLFDPEILRRRMMNDENLADRVLGEFSRDIPQRIAELREALEREDADGAGRIAHRIQGAAANIGSPALRIAAREMEAAGRAGDLPALKARGIELEAAFESLMALLERGNHGERPDTDARRAVRQSDGETS